MTIFIRTLATETVECRNCRRRVISSAAYGNHCGHALHINATTPPVQARSHEPIAVYVVLAIIALAWWLSTLGG